MTAYAINTYEFKPGTEEPDTYVVTVGGKEGPLFATYREAKRWVAAQAKADTRDLSRFDPIANEPDNGDRFY